MANYFINKWDTDKLSNNVIVIFLNNAFLTPALKYFDVNYYLSLIKRKFCIKGKTQRELNQIFENPPMNISLGYSYIFQTILTSVFFVSLFPLGPIINLFGIVLYYFIDKYLLVKRFKKPETINQHIASIYLHFFKFVMFIYTVNINYK